MDKQPEFSPANDYLARLGLQEDPFPPPQTLPFTMKTRI